MRLSDYMTNAGLSAYAEIGLLIFFAVFIAIVLYLYFGNNRESFAQARMIPFEDNDETVDLLDAPEKQNG